MRVRACQTHTLPGLVHQLYWLGFRTLEFRCEGSSVTNPYTPGSGLSALFAGAPYTRISLWGLERVKPKHSRVWSISSIGWGSVCTPGSGPSALLAGVLCALPGLVHQLYWLGFCTLEFRCEGRACQTHALPGLVHQLYWLGLCTLEFHCGGSSVSNP